ncbi:hypothetical protein OIV83_004373 [Microbotryomycetes sp. JL201]|nr:hypothetical protein OIV83_004373 [Microbotryomycetes sp. JL201]
MSVKLRPPPPDLVARADCTQTRLSTSTSFLSATELQQGVQQPYVLYCARLDRDGYVFAGSDDSVRLFAPDLSGSARLRSTQRGVSNVVAGSNANGGNVVFVTAKDGTVVGWDMRDTSKEAIRLKNKTGAGYLTASQSSDGACLAAGAELHNYEATIDFWDLRTTKIAHTYTEAHSDDITCVQFNPSANLSHVLLSASVDGLLNTYDVRITDEDDAVLSTSQVGSSLVRDFDDVRDVALEPWRTDYLIGAHWNAHLGGVCIAAGTQAGDVAIMNLCDPEKWIMERVLPSTASGLSLAHSDIVRCIEIDNASGRVVTGGEDGKVCLWSV